MFLTMVAKRPYTLNSYQIQAHVDWLWTDITTKYFNRSFDNHNSDNDVNHQITDNQATKYSNLQSKGFEIDFEKEVEALILAKNPSSIKDNSTTVTEFSNVECDAATKNSNL